MTDQSTLKALRNKLSDLEDELDTAHETQADLEKQLNELKITVEEKDEKLQLALAEAKEASERCASSEAQLQKLQETSREEQSTTKEPDAGSPTENMEESERLKSELQEWKASSEACQMEKQKLEEELKMLRQQREEAEKHQKDMTQALTSEKQKAEGLESEMQQLKRLSQKEVAQVQASEAEKLKALEAEYRVECQRLQQLCQELESDRDSALERMQRAEEALQRAEEALKQQGQQFQDFSKKSAAEARATAEALGKEVEVRNARIAQLQGEAQRQSQALSEEQRKAHELQEQLTAYVGTHQELFNRFQAAVEQLDSEKDLCKKVASERDSLIRARDEIADALNKERERAEKDRQEAEQVRQELANAEPPGPAQLAVSDVLISVSFKEVDKPLEVKPWDTNFEEVVSAWLQAVQRSGHLQSSLVRYLKNLEETSTAYPLHEVAKLTEVHEKFADAAF